VYNWSIVLLLKQGDANMPGTSQAGGGSDGSLRMEFMEMEKND